MLQFGIAARGIIPGALSKGSGTGSMRRQNF
jgi:hypothetical protein